MPSSSKSVRLRRWTGADLQAFMKRFKIRQQRMAELLMLSPTSGRITVAAWIKKKEEVLYGPVCVALSYLEWEMEQSGTASKPRGTTKTRSHTGKQELSSAKRKRANAQQQTARSRKTSSRKQ